MTKHSTKRLIGQARFSSSQLFIVAVTAAAVGAVIVWRILAATGVPSLYFSPASLTVKQGDVFNVNLLLDPAGQVINSLALQVNYSSDKLQLVGTTYPTSTNVTSQITPTGAVTNLTLPTLTKLGSAPQVMETITFKAVGSGPATVGLASQSKIYSGVAALAGVANIAINITLPPVPVVVLPPPPTILPPPPPGAVTPPPPAAKPVTPPPASKPVTPPPATTSKPTVVSTTTVAPPPAASQTTSPITTAIPKQPSFWVRWGYLIGLLAIAGLASAGLLLLLRQSALRAPKTPSRMTISHRGNNAPGEIKPTIIYPKGYKD